MSGTLRTCVKTLTSFCTRPLLCVDETISQGLKPEFDVSLDVRDKFWTYLRDKNNRALARGTGCRQRLRGIRGAAVAGVLLATAGALFGVAGCHSAYIEATVKNATGGPVSLVEVDYPSASFGRENLANGAEYHYRFKVLGDGATKVLWTDTRHAERSNNGPTLHEGDEGRLIITLAPAAADWDLKLNRR